MNDVFRKKVFDILSEKFGRESVLLEYPFDKTVDGFVLSKVFVGKEIEENCKQINICLETVDDKMKKYVGLILPITFEEVQEQVDDTRDILLNMAFDMVESVSSEININCVKSDTVGLAYEDIVDRLKTCSKSRKQIGTFAKSIEALILYGYNFYDKEEK